LALNVLDALPADVPVARPEEVGLSATRLARVDALVERLVEQRLVPGALCLVARRGRVAHFSVTGQRDVERGLPVEPDTLFRIASMTKPITSVALMTLFEEGRIRLDDPVSRFLPAFEKMQVAVEGADGGIECVPAKRPILVRHLLTHTAGLANDLRAKSRRAFAEAARFRSRQETIGDFVDRLAALPLNDHPGDVWDYSRATCVVGRLVEVVSGRTLADFMQERIFEPLGMTDTRFFLPTHELGRFAAAYRPGPDQRIVLDDPASEESFFASRPGVYFMGSGGLVSTAADYLRFADMLMRGGERGGERILGRKTVELMTASHTGDRFVWLAGPGAGFGLGFGVTLDRGRAHAMPSEGSYTWGGAFCTHWWNDPVERLFGLVMTQVRPYTHLPLREDFQTVVTAAIDD
jgi:CubicO group peptidase (beta-lactamase class C family)